MSLEHLRVLDLTIHLSGPYCAMILADHGADVVKIENPRGGDDMRRTPPFTGGESAPFMLWNRNKRSVTLDLKSAEDLATFKAMAAVADVVIESFKPGTADRLGIGCEALSALNPRLVYCSISGFGHTGPYSTRGGFDLIASGMSGLMSINGPAEGPPFRIPIPMRTGSSASGCWSRRFNRPSFPTWTTTSWRPTPSSTAPRSSAPRWRPAKPGPGRCTQSPCAVKPSPMPSPLW